MDARVAVEHVAGTELHAGAAEDPADGAVGGVGDECGEGAPVGRGGVAPDVFVRDSVRDFVAGA